MKVGGELLHHRLAPAFALLPLDDQPPDIPRSLEAAVVSQAGEFYLRMTMQQGWAVREVARQIDSGLFERAVLQPPRVSTAWREMQPQAPQHFKDAYLLDFLALPDEHSEAELRHGLLMNLGRFLTELGRDFCCIGSEYPVQVGGQDFALDLLFFHRGLNCLVAIELKVTAFQPEHLGKLNFYLEALDRDVRSHTRTRPSACCCAPARTARWWSTR